jgi:hypothetical protein
MFCNHKKTKVEIVRANNIWKIPYVKLFLYKQAHKQEVKICSKSLGYLNVQVVSVTLMKERDGIRFKFKVSSAQTSLSWLTMLYQFCSYVWEGGGGRGYRIPGLLQSNKTWIDLYHMCNILPLLNISFIDN